MLVDTGHARHDLIKRFTQIGQHIVQISDAELARWEKAVAPVVQGWVKRTPDGAKILAAFRAEIKRYRSSK